MSAVSPVDDVALSIRGVRKTFGGDKAGLPTVAVQNLTLDVYAGEFLALVGASGSGKTTTLKMINRLIEPDAGQILIGGVANSKESPEALRRRIGYAFQGVGLFPHLTVAENVAVTPRLLGWPEHEVRSRVVELMMLVELPYEEYGGRYPQSLSGGQRQRIGFARALAARPRIVLLDEPFGAVDPITRDALARAYRELHDRFGLTTVMVTHDLNEALLLVDRLGVMRDGALVALGSPSHLLGEVTEPYVESLMSVPRQQAARLAEKFGVWRSSSLG